MMVLDGSESTWEPINYGRFISQFWLDIIPSMWWLERMKTYIPTHIDRFVTYPQVDPLGVCAWLSDIKLINWSQGAFSPGNICLAGLSLWLGTWDVPKRECQKNQSFFVFFVTAIYESWFLYAPFSHLSGLVSNPLYTHKMCLRRNLNHESSMLVKSTLNWYVAVTSTFCWKQKKNDNAAVVSPMC